MYCDDNWIDVNDRLPNAEFQEECGLTGIKVLVAVYGDIVTEANYSGKNGFEHKDYKSNAVTHWQPLPLPPSIVKKL